MVMVQKLTEGKVEYYNNGWDALGLTDENGEVYKELLPCKYVFRLEYKGQKEDAKQDIKADPVVVFTYRPQKCRIHFVYTCKRVK